MKNIHVLKTDKPSRLLKSKINDIIVLEPINVTNNTRYWEYLNIYITSDEEIKKGDWCFHPLLKGGSIMQSKFDNPNSTMNKIILTTDQDLIKDGVQAIDDEFLEWFVKNPSCEVIFVNKIESFDFEIDKYVYNYKIIIPKEEPKQETLEEAAERYDSQYINRLRPAFIAGAKWQQEQDNKMYSEEEVYQLLYDLSGQVLDNKVSTPKLLDKWFEEFKKK
jgi:hypothetical protein